MSISPPSDLVLDVARAADPQKADAAAARLRQMAAGAAASGFPALLDAAPAAGKSDVLPAGITNMLSRSPRPAVGAGRKLDAYQALGRLVLQQAIEQMLPASSSSVYGEGFAGSVWRSMLAEHMAAALAPSVFRKWPGPAAHRGDAGTFAHHVVRLKS